ncbi:MAG: hypothetical protein V4484_22430 [Pseudomonadota bacterium]
MEVVHNKAQALAERKQALLRQAEGYRVGIVHARSGIAQNARPEALLHSALNHASWALRSRVDAWLHPSGLQAGALLPFALSVIGFITRRRLVQPALGALAVAGAVALYVQRRRANMVHEVG